MRAEETSRMIWVLVISSVYMGLAGITTLVIGVQSRLVLAAPRKVLLPVRLLSEAGLAMLPLLYYGGIVMTWVGYVRGCGWTSFAWLLLPLGSTACVEIAWVLERAVRLVVRSGKGP